MKVGMFGTPFLSREASLPLHVFRASDVGFDAASQTKKCPHTLPVAHYVPVYASTPLTQNNLKLASSAREMMVVV